MVFGLYWNGRSEFTQSFFRFNGCAGCNHWGGSWFIRVTSRSGGDSQTLAQELHLHDERSVHVGVSHQEFGAVVAEAQRLLSDSQQRADSMEASAREIYSQACVQVQHLWRLWLRVCIRLVFDNLVPSKTLRMKFDKPKVSCENKLQSMKPNSPKMQNFLRRLVVMRDVCLREMLKSLGWWI